MALGVIFISAAILIALYPPLLSLIVAAVLFLLGIFFLYFGYQLRKRKRNFGDPFLDFFFKF